MENFLVMVTVSVSELQRKMNEIIMPRILAGEGVQVIDKKTGLVKFHIVPPQEEPKIKWPDLKKRAIKLAGFTEDPAMEALDYVRSDRVL